MFMVVHVYCLLKIFLSFRAPWSFLLLNEEKHKLMWPHQQASAVPEPVFWISRAQCVIQYKLSTAVMECVLCARRLLWGGSPLSLDLVQYRRGYSSTIAVCILG